nr:MAG TPA: hypothetical protein [Caudoviricetes sp.]
MQTGRASEAAPSCTRCRAISRLTGSWDINTSQKRGGPGEAQPLS